MPKVLNRRRRAKLKRLSVDDRERMMRSRALPEHFDRSSALHAGLPATPAILGNVLSPSYGSLAMGNQPGGFLRYGHIRRPSDDPATSPSSNPSVPSESLWTSGSMPGSELQSPVSPVVERGHVWSSIASQIPSPQTTNPYGRSRSFPAIYQPQPPPVGQYPQEHISRMRTGSLASPVAADLDQSAAGPLVFGRSCPPATFDYSPTSQMGLPFQQQGVYDSTQATFAIPPTPSVLQQPQSRNQEAYHQSRVLQQASPPVPQHEFTRPALPEQRMRPAYSAYPTDYPIQSNFNSASPQMANSEEASYQVARASISGPQTQRDNTPEDSNIAPDAQQQQQQQLRVKTGRRRSFTHPPDYSFPR